MENSKISDLTNYTAPQDADVIPIVSVASGITKKMPVSAILPASSTDRAIVRFNGTTGKVVQNSDLYIADLGSNTINMQPSTVADTATNLQISGGVGATNGGTGQISGAPGVGAGNGGNGVIIGGVGGNTGAGGAAFVQGGAGGATSGVGGNAYLNGGAATNGNSDGGWIYIAPGVKNGSGGNGKILIQQVVGSSNYVIVDLSFLSGGKTLTWPNVTGTMAVATSGAGVPTGAAPVAVGQIYVDTSASKIYISKGTSAGSDWLILN